MGFPIINYKATNTDLDERLQTLLEQKLTSLDKYIGEETDIKCDVEFEKMSTGHSGQIYRVEVNLWLAGKLYRAEDTLESFEKAIDEVRSELDKELRRANKKKETLIKRGGRAIKEMMQTGG